MLRLVTLLSLATVILANSLHGVPQHDDRIVGGDIADIRDYPYQLFFDIDGDRYCGASIISLNWALTAAQCSNYPITNMVVRAGSANRTSGGTTHDVVQKFIHPQFNTTPFDYDLALLQVSPSFTYSVSVAPVRLPAQDKPIAEGTPAIVTGWGLTNGPGTDSKVLRVVKLYVTSDFYCWSQYAFPVTDRMICAGSNTGVSGFCNGDGGGPMVINGELIGVTSWGPISCTAATLPDVFARVSDMRDWIREVSGV